MVDAVDASGVDVSGNHVDAIGGFAVVLPDGVGVLRDLGSLQSFPGLLLGELSAEVRKVSVQATLGALVVHPLAVLGTTLLGRTAEAAGPVDFG